ncbi:MAG: redoxin domain-containing protein [Patescibacteria group bacterium]|nr:redoxin domain-containing protein [Patescibacteria group bacterium]
MVLFLVSFIAGVLTVLAPCVLPLLPVIVGGSLAGGSRRRAYTIVASLALSIVAFTLILKASTALIGIPEDLWRYLSGAVVVLFGVFLLFTNLWSSIPGIGFLSQGSNKLLATGYQKGSFWGDALMGAALGPIFASCSPTYFIILATVLPAKPVLGLVYLAAYAVGLSLMLLLIAILGDKLVRKLGITIEPEGWFRRGIGLLFIVVGILVFTGTMKDIETWLVEKGFNVSVIEYSLLGEQEGGVQSVAPSEAGNYLSSEAKAMIYQKAPELVSPDGYINTGGEPITLESLRGKVVLLDIWTYSCINCQRTLPYLRMWYEKYKDEGLVIVGVHTPEFAFEKVKANVERAAEEFGLTYPIIQDNEYRTWNAYGNRYWPRKYLIDIDGYVVYDHIGEGGYAETEAAIQKALKERAERLGMPAPALSPVITPAEVITMDAGQVRSPEIYFGSSRNERLGNGTRGKAGAQTLTIPSNILGNALYLGGTWTLTEEYASNSSAGARIVYKYDAKNVYFVASAPKGATLKIMLDGNVIPAGARGKDVNASGEVKVQEDRLYELVKGTDYGVHTLEIEVVGPGLQAYTFTFG